MDAEEFTNKAKTISYLNSKWWYRLVKVVFILSLLLICSVGIWLVYDAKSPREVFDNEASYVQCNDGRKLGLDENSITLSSSYMWGFEEDQFKRSCAYDPNDPINVNPDRPPDLLRLTPAVKNFQLIEVYKTQGSYSEVVGKSAIVAVIVLIVFEIIRRIFYYIVLGSIIPRKK